MDKTERDVVARWLEEYVPPTIIREIVKHLSEYPKAAEMNVEIKMLRAIRKQQTAIGGDWT